MQSNQPPKAFIWGANGAAMTPEDIAKQKELEDRLVTKGIDTSPVGHWTQGAARVADAIAGAFRRGRLEKASGENSAYNSELVKGILGTTAAPQTSQVPDSSASAEVAATSPAPSDTAPQSVDISGSRAEFVNSLLPAAITESQRTGVDPRIIVAQAAQETGWGRSAPGNNYFGIKSHGQSGGQNLSTEEVINGKRIRINDSFRQFESPADSVRGYGDFITQNPRYAALREAKGIDAQLEALQASGYATDPNYSRSVGSIARGIKLPQQVASLDPSAGMPEAAAAIERTAPGSGVVDAQVSAPNYNPALANAPVAPAEDGGLPPLPVGGTVALPPAVASVPMDPQTNQGGVQRVAQAVTEAPQVAPQPPALNDAILKAMTDPRATPQTRAVAQALMQRQQAEYEAQRDQQTWLQRQAYEQEQKRSDPTYQLGLEKSRLEIDNMKNPRLTPGDKLAREKFDLERGQQGKTADINEYEYAKERGFEGSFPDFILAQKKAGASSTTINTGEGDEFYKNLDKKNAETFSALSDTGMQARGKVAQIDRLEGLMANAPQGALGAMKQAAGEWGIATDGLSDIQAASALLEKMVPEQRAPGSGPMSDADIKMFRASLPRIINQPGGNQLVFQTMRGISQYEIQMGEIADKVANRELSPAEGRKRIATLKNPLSEFKVPAAQTPNEGWKELSPGVRVRKVD